MIKIRNNRCKYCEGFIPQLHTRRNVCRPCACQNAYDLLDNIDHTKINMLNVDKDLVMRGFDMKCTKTIHYCKADKKSGKPVVVTDSKGRAKNVKKWHMDLFDEHGYPVRIEVEFNNTDGKAKRSGATTMLKVMETESWV